MSSKLVALIERAAAEHASRIALTDGATDYTYADLRRISLLVARALRDRGLQSGDRVAVYSPNDARIVLCGQAISLAGGVRVTLNPLNAPQAHRRYLEMVRPTLVLYHRDLKRNLEALGEGTPGLGETQFICVDEWIDDSGSAGSLARRELPPYDPGWFDPSDNAESGITETGGTGGAPKAVVFSRVATEIDYELFCREFPPHRHPQALIVSSMAHAASGILLPMFAMGGTTTIRQRFVPGEVLDDIETLGITHMILPPPSLHVLLSHPDLRRHDYSSLLMLLLIGAATPADTLRKAIEAFGPCIQQCYGQMEIGILTWLDAKTLANAVIGIHPHRLESCGRPCGSAELAVVDDRGNLLPLDQTGEVVARNNSLRWPYGAADRTATTRVDGWHPMGDIGYIDGDGYCYIVGRSSDRIKTSGLSLFLF